jgi:hypothetical protein
MHIKNEKEMRQWSKIAKIIKLGNPPPSLREIHRSHTATISKITFADYHYLILDQFYRPNETPIHEDTLLWARAEMNSIVYNLYSALDSLANEIIWPTILVSERIKSIFSITIQNSCQIA